MSQDEIIRWLRGVSSGDEEVVGSALELLVEILEFQPRRRLPPFPVLKDIVQRGEIVGGMNGALSWAGSNFRFDEEIYKDLEEITPIDRRVTGCDSTTREEWVAWCAKHDFGMEYLEHLALLNSLRDAELARKAAPSAETEKTYMDAVTAYLAFGNRS